jgi:hypothetical protein
MARGAGDGWRRQEREGARSAGPAWGMGQETGLFRLKTPRVAGLATSGHNTTGGHGQASSTAPACACPHADR